MVALVIMRKNTPRPVELVLWIGLIWVCVLGAAGIHDQQTRALITATVWVATQIIGSLIIVAGQSVVQWLYGNRFLIADWAVLLVGVDLLALAFLSSRREAEGWRPQVRLCDWMELPRQAEQKTAPVPVSAVDDVNRRFNVWVRVAAADAMTWTTFFFIWSVDVAVPSMGRRIRKVACSADGARRRVASADWHGLIERAREGRNVADRGRYDTGIELVGRLRGDAATRSRWGIETPGTDRDHRDQLAS